MPYCNHCGRYIDEGHLCEWCGVHSTREDVAVQSIELCNQSDETPSFPNKGTKDSPQEELLFHEKERNAKSHEEPKIKGATPLESQSDALFEKHVASQVETGVFENTDKTENTRDANVEKDSFLSFSEDAQSLSHIHAEEQEEEEKHPYSNECHCNHTANEGRCNRRARENEECKNNRKAKEPPFSDKFYKILSTPDSTSRFTQRDIQANRFMAVLCYLWVLWVVPFIRSRDSRYVSYHLGQGLLLLLLDCLGATFCGIAYYMIGIIPVASPAFAALAEVAILLSLLLKIFGVICACRGKARQLPFIGSYGALKW